MFNLSKTKKLSNKKKNNQHERAKTSLKIVKSRKPDFEKVTKKEPTDCSLGPFGLAFRLD